MDIDKNQINLYPLGKDKDIIIKTFSKDEDVVALLLPDYSPTTSTDDLDVILREHLYKTISIDNTSCEAKAYICVETYVTSVDSDVIKEIGIIINIFCHDSLIDLSNEEIVKFVKKGFYGNRVDMCLDAIDRCLNGKKGIGIGRLRLITRNPIKIYQPINGYYGKSIEYTISDFNTLQKI